VRELKNAIVHAAILRRKRVLTAKDLPEHVRGIVPEAEPFTFRVGMTLEQMEREMIRRTYIANDRNLLKTAAMLGIARGTVYRVLAECGMAPRNGGAGRWRTAIGSPAL
jgi:DNA-binding NtrC family response regulator